MNNYYSDTINLRRLILSLAIMALLAEGTRGQSAWVDQVYNPDVPGIEHNPMKGWMPGYKGINSDFPYSIDHFYMPLDDVYLDWGKCDWSAFEAELDRIVGTGSHVVTRFFIDYPNQSSAMPGFLVDDTGYKVPMYDENSPDWNDDTLMVAMEEFIEMFGARYDGDPRIAFIEAGLYGFWGEWHTYPETSWAMSQANKDRILIAYDNAFDATHIGLRQSNHASTYDLKMSVGYYDDSFAYNTLCTGSWCSWNGNLVPDGITHNYKYHPFAGELRPQIQNNIFDAWPNDTYSAEDNMIMEDLETCIRSTRLSFMKAYYLYNKIPTQTEFENALRAHKMMGYEFFISSVQLDADHLSNVTVNVKILNKGVAPMYYSWPVEFAAINSDGEFLGVFGTADWEIHTIYPDSAASLKTFAAPIYGNDTYTILMRFANPLEAYTSNARALRFANEHQDSERDGWLTLGTVTIDADEVETTEVIIENCPADSIRAGENHAFTSTVLPFNATDQTVYWQISEPAIARIDSLGMLTALARGTTTITLYNHDSTVTDHCIVKVSDPDQWPFEDVNRSVPGRVEAEHFDEGGEGIAYHDDEKKNGNMLFRPEVMVDFNTHDRASNAYVVGWTADGEWLEYTLDVESGMYDITLLYHSGESPGELRILLDNEEVTTITEMQNQGNWGIPAKVTHQNIEIAGGVDKILRLEISGQGFDIDAIDFKFHVDATGVSVGSCPSGELAVGTTHQLTSIVEPADASERAVTWSSSDPGVATVTAYGMVNGIAEGTAMITVTTMDGGFTDQCEITIFNPPVPVTGVELSGCPESELAIDGTVQLNAEVSPANADDTSVSWSSSDPLVLSVDQGGLVAAIAPGTATITVTTTDGGYSASCEMTVEEPFIPVTGVAIADCPADSLKVDSTYQLSATIFPQEASDQDVSWHSSDGFVATVDATGLVTAVSAGEAVISVTTKDGGFSGECIIGVMTTSNINDLFSSPGIARIFPNPSSNRVFVRFSEPGTEKMITIYNLSGRLLRSESTFDSEMEFDIREISEGAAMIFRIQSGDKVDFSNIVVAE